MSASPRHTVVATEPLTERDLAELRAQLEDERATLSARAAELLDEDDRSRATPATHAHGETERAVVDAERRVNAVLEAGARDALDEVVQALARIEDGTYGRCEDCDAQIPAERLRARPAARFCVRCQQSHDFRR
jgi:RNA polymerase-binding protein DksA